ncbi:hypothetical protein MTP99_007638 [Tenebrio molitor]|nr:hypothetical protein MTP99_007638 [Tenebrio molitor]
MYNFGILPKCHRKSEQVLAKLIHKLGEQSYCELLKRPNNVSLGLNNNEYGKQRSGLMKHPTYTRSVWNNNEYGRQRSELVKQHTNTRNVWADNRFDKHSQGVPNNRVHERIGLKMIARDMHKIDIDTAKLV